MLGAVSWKAQPRRLRGSRAACPLPSQAADGRRAILIPHRCKQRGDTGGSPGGSLENEAWSKIWKAIVKAYKRPLSSPYQIINPNTLWCPLLTPCTSTKDGKWFLRILFILISKRFNISPPSSIAPFILCFCFPRERQRISNQSGIQKELGDYLGKFKFPRGLGKIV